MCECSTEIRKSCDDQSVIFTLKKCVKMYPFYYQKRAILCCCEFFSQFENSLYLLFKNYRMPCCLGIVSFAYCNTTRKKKRLNGSCISHALFARVFSLTVVCRCDSATTVITAFRSSTLSEAPTFEIINTKK